MLSRRVAVIYPRHNSLGNLPYLKRQLIQGLGVMYHAARKTAYNVSQPFEITAFVFIIIVLIVMITDIERRVHHDTILEICIELRHPLNAVHVIYLVNFQTHNITLFQSNRLSCFGSCFTSYPGASMGRYIHRSRPRLRELLFHVSPPSLLYPPYFTTSYSSSPVWITIHASSEASGSSFAGCHRGA